MKEGALPRNADLLIGVCGRRKRGPIGRLACPGPVVGPHLLSGVRNTMLNGAEIECPRMIVAVHSTVLKVAAEGAIPSL